jgi:malate dehydrogenase (oxaloacetate-decarboxylating)(NADP+)
MSTGAAADAGKPERLSIVHSARPEGQSGSFAQLERIRHNNLCEVLRLDEGNNGTKRHGTKRQMTTKKDSPSPSSSTMSTATSNGRDQHAQHREAARDRDALEYHRSAPAGKVEVRSSKPCQTDKALALAYSPGVAAPCKEIAKNPEKVYEYTTKGNLVAVITNGTAVLGLGDIGPLAGKPVMEGKGVLFKQFANINVFDLELNAKGVDEFCAAVKALEPTFGGINLEDIKAPECFEIEERLKREMRIPVFHDDQHGTAIISGAALLNACELTGRKMSDVKVVMNGAGAASISCARIFMALGVQPKNLMMCDSKGVVYKGRTEGMNRYKAEFAVETSARTLSDALKGADCFVGLSVAGAVTPEMLKTMAPKPLIFAMANPDPEIDPPAARQVRPDAIIATGRSDYPNQVNNVLGFPFIFRGALDVRATQINEEMKLAAVHALAKLAREDVPERVSSAYGGQQFEFGPDYIIPKPFDPRVLLWVTPAVAKAAMESGVAQQPIGDLTAYRERLEALQGAKTSFVRQVINRVRAQSRSATETGRRGGRSNQRPVIYFPEGSSSKVLKAVQTVLDEEIISPVLLGYPDQVKARIDELGLDDLKSVQIIHPTQHPRFKEYIDRLFEMRQRKGVMWREAERLMSNPDYFAAMAVHMGDADGLVTGATRNYAECVTPILEVIGPGRRRVASGLNVVLFKDKMLFFADTTVNIDPTAEQCATIAIHAARVAEYFKIQPRIAMLSYTNFRSKGANPQKMRLATEIVKKQYPHYIVDGEMQADTAVNPEIVERIFPFCEVKNGANILVFPNLDSGNIAYKLVQQLGGAEVIGPFLMGVKKPANVLQRTCTVDDIINTIALTALQSQAMSELPSTHAH